MRGAFATGLMLAAGLAIAFLVFPIVALFAEVSPRTLVAQLGSEAARDALWVSLRTGLVAHALVLVVGTPAAYLLATREFRGRQIVLAAVELPLVLPPAVAGIALLTAFGRRGLLGEHLDAAGITIAFTDVAVVIAVAFVAAPFYLRFGVAAFSAVDRSLLDAARTLGAPPARTCLRVALPAAASGLGAASAVAWGRGLGEFGATTMFAGSFAGETRTLPPATYAELDRDREAPIAIGALLVAISLAVLLVVKLLPSWTRSTSPFPTGSALSRSS